MAENEEGTGGDRRPFDIESAISSLIARSNNDARAALRTLSEDNYQYRRQIRSLKRQVTDLQKRPELKEGQQIVSKEDAEVLTGFKALNLKLEDVKTGLDERNTLKAEKAERKKAEGIAKGLKPLKLNPEVMTDLISTRSLEFENREYEIEEDGEKTTVTALHLRQNKDGEWMRADKYAEKHLKGYLPALRVGDDDDSEDSQGEEEAESSRREQGEPPRRQPFPKQASGSGSKAPRNSAEIADRHIQGRYVPPSKLRETQKT